MKNKAVQPLNTKTAKFTSPHRNFKLSYFLREEDGSEMLDSNGQPIKKYAQFVQGRYFQSDPVKIRSLRFLMQDYEKAGMKCPFLELDEVAILKAMEPDYVYMKVEEKEVKVPIEHLKKAYEKSLKSSAEVPTDTQPKIIRGTRSSSNVNTSQAKPGN